MKKIIFLLFLLVSVFIIYKAFSNEKINFLSIGDYKITNENLNNIDSFSSVINEDYLIIDLTSDIYNNKNNLKSKLSKSDILLVSIGESDIKNIIHNSNNILNNYNEIDKIITSYKILIEQIKKYARGKIIVMGVYNKDIDNNYIKYFNNNLKSILDNDISYIDFNDYLNSSKTKKEIVSIYINNGLFDL